MLTVISYDISHERRRRKVRQCLEGYGRRVQYSVFECDLSPAQFSRVRAQVQGLIDGRVDSVRWYRLDARSRALVVTDGAATDGSLPPVWLIG